MKEETIQIIKTNPLIYNYLRVDSSWYKYLVKSPKYIKEVEKQAKKYYKLTATDKLNKLSKNIELITTFIDVLK